MTQKKTTEKKKTPAKKTPAKKASTKKDLPGEIIGEMNGLPLMRVRAGLLDGAAYNPRDITEAAMEGLKKSKNEFGLTQPIIWNRRTQNIVGGHQRHRTLDENEETDVVVVDLAPEREKALNVALNSKHLSGHWTANLRDVLAEIEEVDADLFGDLRLDELKLDVPKVPDMTAPEDFPEFDDENIATETQCPKCGYSW